MSGKHILVDQKETTQLKKISCRGCSHAGHSTKDTNSRTDKSLEVNKSNRRDYNSKDVFLSHSGKQKNFVRQLYADLTNQDVSCFFDQDHESLPVAEDFPSIIFQAAKTCKVALLLLSKDFLETKWPMLELSAFVEARDKTRTNPDLKILPLFFLISPGALKDIVAGKGTWKQSEISGDKLQALNAIRRTNGLNFKEGDDEVEFRKNIVKEILHILPPSQRYHIPSMQGEQRMCQEVADFFNAVYPTEKGISIAGLYGIAGHGKTSLGKAFCNLKLRDFEGKVCHLEFSTGDKVDSFERRKLALQYLSHCPQSYIQTLTKDKAEVEFYKRVKGQRVLLVLDNITEESIDEVRYYIQADLGKNSFILLSARSLDVLIKHFKIDLKSCMHVPRLEEDDAIAILLQSTSAEELTLAGEDKSFALKCANRCLFRCDTVWRGRTYHPLALKAFGRHLFGKHGWNLSKWVAEIDGSVDRSGYGLEDVFDVLGTAFDDTRPKYRTIFMLLTIYMLPNMSLHKVIEWLAIICNEEISFIYKAVEDLRKKAFIEEFEPEIRIHDLVKEFAQSRAKEMGRWLWWKGDASSTRGLISQEEAGFEMVKLEQCMYRRPSQIARRYLSNILVLQLVGVQKMNKLDFSQMDNLRSITLCNCKDLVALEGMENLVQLAWLQISETNPKFELANLSSLEGLKHLEIDISTRQILYQLGDLTSCLYLKEINVRCPSLSEFPRLTGLPHLEKVEFSMCDQVKRPLDCTDCVKLQSIVLSGCCQMAASPLLSGCKELSKLVLWDCDAVMSCPNIDVLRTLKTLKLFISSQASSAPRNLESCYGLVNLQLWNMRGLKNLPSFRFLSNLTVLELFKCGIREPPDLTYCFMLEDVYFFALKYLERFPNFSSLRKLKNLSLYNCRRVKDPPDIGGCHELQVFDLLYNDNLKGLPKLEGCPRLAEIKVSWRCEDEVTYDGIDPDSWEVDDDDVSWLEHFKDVICTDIWSFPEALKELHLLKDKPMLAKKYFRGLKMYYSITAPYESCKRSKYFSQNSITLRLVDSKVIALPSLERVCDDPSWLKKVREYLARAPAASASSGRISRSTAPSSPRYYVPAMQGEARMCQEVADFLKTVRPNENGIRIAGLYGMPGQGKTALGKAFCNINLQEYDGKVCHLEFSACGSLKRILFALHYLTHCRGSTLRRITSEGDARCFFNTTVKGQRVLLVLDNITEESIDEVRYYLGTDLGTNSVICLTAQSVGVLKNYNIDSRSCMHVPKLGEEEAIAILLEKTSLELSAMRAVHIGFALKCAESCSFKEDTAFAPTFHPLALKALGRHFFAKHGSDLSKWVAEIDGLADRARDGSDVVFAVLEKAYGDMDPRYCSIFKLLAGDMRSKLSSDVVKSVARNCNEEITYIKEAVTDLYENAFIEEIEPEIRMHDLVKEYAQTKKWEDSEAAFSRLRRYIAAIIFRDNKKKGQ